MSENKIPEQIHLTQAEIKRFWFARGWRNLQVKRHSSENYTSYILKSKYDSLLKEKEELEKKLSEVNKVNFDKPCYCKNQNMTGGLICHGNCRYI